jgi:dTDP-4-dehydrorhamnose reductase
MKKILILGKRGQIGWELCRTMSPLGAITAVDKAELNLCDFDQIRSLIHAIKPNIILNAAAYTNVEMAEEEKELAETINGTAPGILAQEAKALNALFVHYSTDYVFDGVSQKPYKEADPVHPLNVYGQSKLLGERAIIAQGGRYLILRTGWVYGRRGKNFLRTMLDSPKESLRVVNDQIGAPTWSRWIAEATAQILAQNKEKWGLFHLTASGETSWYDFAKAIFTIAQKTTLLYPIPSNEYRCKAHRPLWSVLSNEKIENAFDIFLPDWKEGLKQCLEE